MSSQHQAHHGGTVRAPSRALVPTHVLVQLDAKVETELVKLLGSCVCELSCGVDAG